MRVAINMPRLGDEDQALIVSWLKKVGDSVARGETVAEIETDKATLDVEVAQAGTIVEIVHDVGAEVAVGSPIAYLETGDRDAA